METLHGPAVVVTAEVAMPPHPDEAYGLMTMGRPEPLNQLGVLARAETVAPPRLGNPFSIPAQIQPLDAVTNLGRPTRSSLDFIDAPPSTAQRDRPMPLFVVLADNRGTDSSSVRFLLWPSPIQPGMPPGFDARSRFAELLHDTVLTGHLPSLLDGAHSGADSDFNDETVLVGGRHHAVNPTMFGQSAKTDFAFAGTGRSIGDVSLLPGVQARDEGATSSRESVGPLVAMGDATTVWAAAVWVAGSRALGAEVDGSAVDAALHELLAPRFAVDAAALGDAIRDLVSDADELGSSLLGFLPDPSQSSEMALIVALAAGVAYRHCRTKEQREQAESRALLAARFITGPASLRLSRRNAS